jgi:folylpolyglutamate synthase/dihydropteroate synthase
VDVAHNELASGVLADALVNMHRANDRPVMLVLGMSRGHDPAQFLQSLTSTIRPEKIWVCEPSFRALPAETIANAARQLLDGDAVITLTQNAVDAAKEAVRAARQINDSIVLVTGSFYTVGDILPETWQEILESG